MTKEGIIEPVDIIDTISAISRGEKDSYAVINENEIISLLPVLGTTIQSLETNANMIPDPIVQNYLIDMKQRLTKLNVSIQTQMVRNAQFKSKKAIA